MRGRALILGGSRWQTDLIRRASELGLRTIVTDISEHAPGRMFANEFIQIDTNDRRGLLEIARAKQASIVLADQTDRIVPVAAFLNEQLGLKGIRPDTARVFTDKYEMRNALASSDVKMPHYAEVATVEEALKAVTEWGYPAILKPKNSQSSCGVFRVENEPELRQWFADSLKESHDGRILIEEFVEGTEVTVEGFSLEGKCTVLAISEKEHYSFNPCVARRLAYPPRFEPETLRRIRETNEKAVDTLGLQDGISHAEYRMSNGFPYLIEVAARGGGNRIASVIIPHVSGVDAYEMLINRLMGQEAKMPHRLNRSGNLEFLDFKPGKVKAIRGLDEVRNSDLACDIRLHFQVGDTLCEPADDKSRLGYFISLGETRDEIDEKSARVRELISIEYD
jgi:biotin carboxylase